MTVPIALASVAAQLTQSSAVRQSRGPSRVARIALTPPNTALRTAPLKRNLRKSGSCRRDPRYPATLGEAQGVAVLRSFGAEFDGHVEWVARDQSRCIPMRRAERQDVAAAVANRNAVPVPVAPGTGLADPDVEGGVLRSAEFGHHPVGYWNAGRVDPLCLLQHTGKFDCHVEILGNAIVVAVSEGTCVRIAILAAGLLLLGVVALLTGVLSPTAALALGARVWPILLFVVAITVVTELAAAAGLFGVIAERLARWGLGRAWLLWVFVVVAASVSTIFLSLDTTAVLLTPVVIVVARSVGLPVMPF